MTGSRYRVAAWATYDWANSAFPTLVVTFVYSTYFTQAIAPDELSGTTLWSRAVALSAILVAVISPLLGAMADRSGRRLGYLMAATWVTCAASAALAFVQPGFERAVLLALGLFVIANVAFEVGMVFYNAFLPDIAPAKKIGRISGWGWGLGYVGGLLCLVIALVVLVLPEKPLFGISTVEGFNIRATNLLVAAWFLVFSVPMFLLGGRGPVKSAAKTSVLGAYREVLSTLGGIAKHAEIAKLLLARLIYNDGLVTVFAFGGIYAAGTFGMTLAEVIEFGIAINVAAGIGAWLFGFVDDRLGGKTTILITLAGLTGCTLLAVFAPTRAWFWVAGMGIGIFVGPNQSASRSLLGRFVPPARYNEFFGFFAFSGKITAFLGPLLLGSMTAWFESQRAGVATVLVFFVVGAGLLLMVDEKKGIEEGTRK